jgi:hypothetical protein
MRERAVVRKVATHSGLGPGLGLGKPKQDSCLRFGLSVYRIFGSETEEGGSRAQDHLGLSSQIFVLGKQEMQRHSGEWSKDRKSVLNSTTK